MYKTHGAVQKMVFKCGKYGMSTTKVGKKKNPLNKAATKRTNKPC